MATTSATWQCLVCLVVIALIGEGPQGKKVTRQIFGVFCWRHFLLGTRPRDHQKRILLEKWCRMVFSDVKIRPWDPFLWPDTSFEYDLGNPTWHKLDLVTFFPGRPWGPILDTGTNGTFPYGLFCSFMCGWSSGQTIIIPKTTSSLN